MQTKEVSLVIVSSAANYELRQALLPNKEKEIEIDGIKFRPSYVVLDASEGVGEIWVWGIAIAKGIASLVVLEAFKKFILPKLIENSKVVGINIGSRRIEKKKEAIEKAFLEEIERLENNKDEKPSP